MNQEKLHSLYTTLIYEQRDHIQEFIREYLPTGDYPKIPTKKVCSEIANEILEIDRTDNSYILACLDEWLIKNHDRTPHKLTMDKLRDFMTDKEITYYAQSYLDRFMEEIVETTLEIKIELHSARKTTVYGSIAFPRTCKVGGKKYKNNKKERVTNEEILEQRKERAYTIKLSLENIECYYKLVQVIRHEYTHAYAYVLGYCFGDGETDFEKLCKSFLGSTAYVGVWQKNTLERRFNYFTNPRKEWVYFEGVTLKRKKNQPVEVYLDETYIGSYINTSKLENYRGQSKNYYLVTEPQSNEEYYVQKTYLAILSLIEKYYGETEDTRREVDIVTQEELYNLVSNQ